jgi:hypothetical protein
MLREIKELNRQLANMDEQALPLAALAAQAWKEHTGEASAQDLSTGQ